MSNKTFLSAATRGNTNIGWLNGFHSFSFGPYYNPERLQFGTLRVLNDDTVQAGQGFGTHSHSNMEIISIPLSGTISHRDSTGKEAVIHTGDIQVMSAGTGISHSEYNLATNSELKFLQIWINPDQQNVQPRYQQLPMNNHIKNQFNQIVSPDAHDEGLWIHQKAWLHLGKFDEDQTVTYNLKKPGNGVYLFLLNGKVEVDTQVLNSRDAIALTQMQELRIAVKDQSEILLIEVPLK
jgi:redox-sensitive bicupin YhaK (pirin superfamily)